MPDITAPEQGNRSIMRKVSQISLASRLSTQTQPVQVESYPSKANTTTQPVTTHSGNVTAAKRPQTSHSTNNIRRRVSQNKQVSFVEGNENQPERLTPKTVTLVEVSDQPVALTKKNLNLYNAMVLKTIRTSKFDER